MKIIKFNTIIVLKTYILNKKCDNMVQEVFTGSLIYSHILPAILGFLSIIFLCNGIMDDNKIYTIVGVVMFFSAGLLPFVILPIVLGV